MLNPDEVDLLKFYFVMYFYCVASGTRIVETISRPFGDRRRFKLGIGYGQKTGVECFPWPDTLDERAFYTVVSCDT